MPKEYVTAGWLKVAATINPTTYVFDSMRSLLNTGWDGDIAAGRLRRDLRLRDADGDHGALGGARRHQDVVARRRRNGFAAAGRWPPHRLEPCRLGPCASPASSPRACARAAALLRSRDFRNVFIAQSVSVFGDGITPVALTFAVLDLTGSGTDLGLVLAAQSIPLVAAGAGRRRVGGQAAARRDHGGQRPRPRGRPAHRRGAAADGRGADLAARRARRLARRRRGVLPAGGRRHPAADRAGPEAPAGQRAHGHERQLRLDGGAGGGRHARRRSSAPAAPSPSTARRSSSAPPSSPRCACRPW